MEKERNTCFSPLILRWTNGEYRVNKPQDQSGEYVDKAIADELLGALVIFCKRVESGEIKSKHTYNYFKQLIDKATIAKPATSAEKEYQP